MYKRSAKHLTNIAAIVYVFLMQAHVPEFQTIQSWYWSAAAAICHRHRLGTWNMEHGTSIWSFSRVKIVVRCTCTYVHSVLWESSSHENRMNITIRSKEAFNRVISLRTITKLTCWLMNTRHWRELLLQRGQKLTFTETCGISLLPSLQAFPHLLPEP